jgi:TPR repeat protein
MTGNPDMFATINPRASKQESDADWLVSMTVGAIGPAQYDAKLQVVMKDVGDSHLNVELPEPQPERSAVSYSTRAQELGKEAVVCYTARPPQSEQSLRLTKFYLIKNGSKAGATLFASFVPARESTLEPASDKPCGGLKATKAAPLSTETEAAAPAERKAKRMAVGAPDMFVHITAGAGDPSARYRRFPATTRKPTTSGWQVSVGAVPIHGTHYDVKVQVVMKDIGAGHSSVELADLKPYRLPNLYMASTEALGKQAIVCYTARPADSQQAERWTGTYNIEAGYQEGTATFVAAHEPTLEVASDAPCGGAAVTKAAAPPPAAEESGPREEAVSSPSSRLALSRSRLALSQGSRLYNAKRYAESRPLLIQACDEGASADACNSVGFMYQNHLGVATDYAKAREYYLKACNDESSLSCSNLGTMYRDGLGVPRDNHQAAVLFEKACDAGVPTGCDFGGKMYMEGSGVQVDGPRALDLFKRACEAELAAGCGDEGNIYARGIGVPRDMPFAVSLFRKACDMGSPNGCYSCGSIYRAGDGVPRDPLKAREYFNKACSLGQQQSCTLAMQ